MLEFSVSKDFVDDNTGDYHLFFGDLEIKVRRMGYFEQTAFTNKALTVIGVSDISEIDFNSISLQIATDDRSVQAQMDIIQKLFYKKGDSYVHIKNETVWEDALSIIGKPNMITGLSVIIGVIMRLLVNFINTGGDVTPPSSSQEPENTSQGTANIQKRH